MEVTVAQMKQIEQNADARGLRYPQMMENAGQAAAKALLAHMPEALHTLAVFCGTGNNGGDGFVLARALGRKGAKVRVVLVGGEPKTADARKNYDLVRQMGVEIWNIEQLSQAQRAWIHSADAVVDAIYGTGFHGELRPVGRMACDLMNRAAGFCLALDLPSGLHADTGEAAEGTVQADLTVTFHASKPCHRLNSAQCGKVEVVSIGIEGIPQTN